MRLSVVAGFFVVPTLILGGLLAKQTISDSSVLTIVNAATANELQALATTPITIRTHFWAKAGTNPSDGSSWPKLALFVNNGKTYDGPYDYGSCAQAGDGCGTPNLYADKLQPGNCGNYFCPTAQEQVIDAQVTVGKLITQAYPASSDHTVTKLSYVFFNDYWDPSTNPVTDRDVGISKIEFIAPDGTVLESLTPNSPTFGVEPSNTANLIGAYFDNGLVNSEGTSDNEQNGMVGAFDKVSTQTILENQSREQGKWLLTKEGSFNLVAMTLGEKITAHLKPQTPPVSTPTVSCKQGSGDQATFTWQHSSELVKKYILRIDKNNSCKNENQETIGWFCGKAEEFPNNSGDQYYIFNATGQDGVCASNGICSVTKPVVPNSEYVTASIQWVLEDNVTTADATRIGSSSKFSCQGQVVEPLRGDFNNDNSVDIFDYNLLYEKLGTQACSLNLTGSDCNITSDDLIVFATLFGSKR